MLSNNVNAARPVRVTIFSTGGKFLQVSNFMEVHALTLAACSYALVYDPLALHKCWGEKHKQASKH